MKHPYFPSPLCRVSSSQQNAQLYNLLYILSIYLLESLWCPTGRKESPLSKGSVQLWKFTGLNLTFNCSHHCSSLKLLVISLLAQCLELFQMTIDISFIRWRKMIKYMHSPQIPCSEVQWRSKNFKYLIFLAYSLILE